MCNKKFSSIKTALVLMATALILLYGCGRKNTAETSSGLSEEEHQHEHVTLTVEAIELAGIKLAKLTPQEIQTEIEVPAEVVLNPRSFYRLTTRVPGRVEELLAYEGDRVKKGQVVARLFSLNYLESLGELRLSLERLKRAESLNSPEKETAENIYKSAREKLRLLGLTEEKIDQIQKSEAWSSHYELTSPADGLVIKRYIFPGDQVDTGAVLLEIASFNRVWVEGSVPERDLGWLKPGMEATVRSNFYPGEEIIGKVTFIDPALDSSTRTVRVRVEVANFHERLKPGMYVELALRVEKKIILAVPEEAVVEIEGQKTIFLPEGPGVFVPRAIRTGPAVKGWLPVISGLSEGEEYVASGAFMLKAELLKHTLEGDHRHD